MCQQKSHPAGGFRLLFALKIIILSEVFYQADDEGREEEELDGVADSRHDAAAGQLGAALHPKPAWRHCLRPAGDADDEAHYRRHAPQRNRQCRRILQEIQPSENKSNGTDKLKKPKKDCHKTNLFP